MQVRTSKRAPPWNSPAPNSPVAPAMARKVVWHSRHADWSTFSFWPVTSTLVEGTKSLTMLTGENGGLGDFTETRTITRCTFEGSYVVPAAPNPAMTFLANRYT